MTPAERRQPLLAVRDLDTTFATEDSTVRAVGGVSFAIGRGETFALVGESGCGKSVTALSILRLLNEPPAKIAAREIALDGLNLLDLDERQMRRVRGGQISMIFQEPMTSLNPVFTCGSQIVEAIQLHQPVSYGQARDQAIDLLAKVGIPEPAQRFGEYPHQMSGGMRQRVMIAMALSCNPKLLIADEPTTALDVTIQAQILDLLRDLQESEQLAVLMITHDLAVVAETAHTVAVMYASRMIEHADVNSLFAAPQHPYTQGLLRAVPKLSHRQQRMATIEGTVPDAAHFPDGCKFHPRCQRTRELAAEADSGDTAAVEIAQGRSVRIMKRCGAEEPALRWTREHHCVACWYAQGYAGGTEADPSRPPVGAGQEANP